MFMPTRIDHHGWQLALLALGVAGDRRPEARARRGDARARDRAVAGDRARDADLSRARRRGDGAVLDRRPRRERRLAAYAATLAGGTALGFLVFASYANRAAVCDALSPVWLSDALLGGALLFALAVLSPGDWKRRLALAAGAGVVDRRLPRADVAALPVAARRRVARSRAAVAEPCARGAAGLSPRLADRDR